MVSLNSPAQAVRPALRLLAVLGLMLFTTGTALVQAQTPFKPIQIKLEKIILPRVGCENAPADEFFEYLVVKSRDNDLTTTDRARKGVQITVTSKRKSSALISMDLQQVSLEKAIREGAALAKMTVTITNDAVIIGDP